MTVESARAPLQFTSAPAASDLIWASAASMRPSIFSVAVGAFATTTGVVG